MGDASAVSFAGGSAQELREWLEAAGVGTGAWGQGASKSVDMLWEEVQEGESSLQREPGAAPLRVVQVLNVVIRNSQGQVLTEAEQVLPSGSRRARGLTLSEKLLLGEGWEAAVARAIREELGPVLPPAPQIGIDRQSYRQEVEERESQSYPGLRSKYVCHRVSVLNLGQELPQGSFTTSEQRSDGLLQHVWEWR